MVESDGLENHCSASYPGFESLSLRQKDLGGHIQAQLQRKSSTCTFVHLRRFFLVSPGSAPPKSFWYFVIQLNYMDSIEFLRQFRFYEYAVFDFAVSFIGVYLLSPFLSKIFLKIKIDIPKKNWLFLTLPISILVHFIIGEITPMTKYFLDINSHYFLKILIIGLLIMGIKDIKIIKK